jgi:hypothetical protein
MIGLLWQRICPPELHVRDPVMWISLCESSAEMCRHVISSRRAPDVRGPSRGQGRPGRRDIGAHACEGRSQNRDKCAAAGDYDTPGCAVSSTRCDERIGAAKLGASGSAPASVSRWADRQSLLYLIKTA